MRNVLTPGDWFAGARPCSEEYAAEAADARKRSGSRPLVPAMVLAGAGLFLGFQSTAQAVCQPVHNAPVSVMFSPPPQLPLKPGLAPGETIWEDSQPLDLSALSCSGGESVQVVNPGGPPVDDESLFPTGAPGVSYRLLLPDAAHPLTPDARHFGWGASTVTLELVYTGGPRDISLPGGILSELRAQVCRPLHGHHGAERSCNRRSDLATVLTFAMTPLVLVPPACTIRPESRNKVVTLPTISQGELSGAGTTAGEREFELELTDCPPSVAVSITVDSSEKAEFPGVLMGSGGRGMARGVGVQLLQGDGHTPVDFGRTFVSGVASGSDYGIKLHARYYQLSTQAGSGSVQATATYTLTYD